MKPRIGQVWWDAELIRLRAALRRFLRQKLPALPHEHEDLLQDTLLDLTREIQERPEVYPESWREEAAQVPRQDWVRFYRLAFTILRRHIAEWFARRARTWVPATTRSQAAAAASTTVSSPERRYLVEQMLRICIQVLAEASEEDRRLLARVTSGGHDKDQKALTTRERQRLHRLRGKLAAEVVKQLGASASHLLTETE